MRRKSFVEERRNSFLVIDRVSDCVFKLVLLSEEDRNLLFKVVKRFVYGVEVLERMTDLILPEIKRTGLKSPA